MAVFVTEALTRHFTSGASQIRALDGVGLRVEEGEFLAITGPSGSGKTTLLQLLALLDGGFEGTLSFRDQDISRLNAAQRARIRLESIGVVYQTFNLLPAFDVIHNVALPYWHLRGDRKRALERAEELLLEVGLKERLLHLVSRLSGGEMQRVAIARALVNAPAVMLADEPTGNLDARSTEAVLETFSRINAAGTTVIVITHEPDVRDVAQRVVNLRYGRIDGPEAETRG